MTATKRSIEKINISKVGFDPENPRLPNSFVPAENDESTVVTWFVDNANLTELLESIASQGFFDGEPVLGYKNGNEYIVVEGNRRLAAVKLFNDPSLSSSKVKKIKEIINDAEVPPPADIPFIEYSERREILDYLGYRHITGVKSWGALAKAKYLNQMRGKLLEEHPEIKDDITNQFKRLAKEIGTKSDYVGRLLTGLTLYETIEENEFFGLSEINEESLNFSLLTTALSYTNISNFLGLSSPQDVAAENIEVNNLAKLVVWIYKKNDAGITRLEDSRNLSMLSKIVAKGSEEALAYFESGDLKISEAVLFTNHPDEILEESISDVVKKLKIALEYSSHIDEPNDLIFEKIKESSRYLKSIHDILVSKKKDSGLEEL